MRALPGALERHLDIDPHIDIATQEGAAGLRAALEPDRPVRGVNVRGEDVVGPDVDRLGRRGQTAARAVDPGDMEEALNAASSIGDDRLQKQSQGYVVPESFTHGSSAQRVESFRRGFQSGDVKQCGL